jgi:transposase
MAGKRTRYSAEFKAKVALEALRGELTAAQLAATETAKAVEADVEKLHAKIGQLLVERDFLAKASGR